MKPEFWCVVCQIYMESQASYNNHMVGKKHQKLVDYTARLPSCSETGIVVSDLPKNINRNELIAYLTQFGKLTNEYFPGDHRPVAWFVFENLESYERATSSVSHLFCGQTIQVKPWSLTGGLPPPKSVSLQDLSKAIFVREQSLPKTSKAMLHNASTPKVVPPPVTVDARLSIEEQLPALMRGLLLPSNCVTKFVGLCNDLTYVLRPVFPYCELHAFGSTITGLAFSGSDVDVFLQTNASRQDLLPKTVNNQVFRQLLRHRQQFTNVCNINAAKVPIVKLLHVPTELSCDISNTNALGVRNSSLIKYFLSVDPRVKELIVLLKYWRKLCGLFAINNYSLTMKALFYLQQLERPIVPTVALLQAGCEPKELIELWECSFDNKFRFGPVENTTPTLELLAGFFEYYATFNYECNVICPLLGEPLPRLSFRDVSLLPKEFEVYKLVCASKPVLALQAEADRTICVQDPFVLNHNITRGLTVKIASQLVSHYKHFSDFCRKVLPSSQNFLHEFIQESATIRMKLEVAISAERRFTILYSSIMYGLPHIESDCEARKVWYTQTFRYLVDAMEKVLRLRVCMMECADDDDVKPSASKRQKLDVTSVSFATPQTVTFFCEGTRNMMNWRKEGRKVVESSSKGNHGKLKSPIEVEEAITEYLLSRSLPVGTYDTKLKKPLMFTCSFNPKANPTGVELIFGNLAGEIGMFMATVNFLLSYVRKLIIESHNFVNLCGMAQKLLKENE